MKICVIYRDELTIFTDSFEQHLERKIRSDSYTIKRISTQQKRVKFLEHVVSEHGIETDPDKIDKIYKWPISDNADELRSFPCLCRILSQIRRGLLKDNKTINRSITPYYKEKKQIERTNRMDVDRERARGI